MRWRLAAGIALGGALVAGLLVQAAQVRGLERRLEDLEARTATRAERALRPTESGPSLGASGVARREFQALAERVAEIARRHEARAAGDVPSASNGAVLDVSVGDAEFDEAVLAAIERGVEQERFRAALRRGAAEETLPNKPRFEQLARALALDDDQAARFRAGLEDMQSRLVALLSEERSDGVVLLEELVRAETLPADDPGRLAAWANLFRLHVPGTQETYVERALAMARDFRASTREYLRPEQAESFANMQEVDLFGVTFD